MQLLVGVSYIKSNLYVYRMSQNDVTFRILLKPKNHHQNFPMDMTWECLILLCLEQETTKNNNFQKQACPSPVERGVGYW